MKYKEYVPSEQYWKDMYAQYPAMFRVVEKFPIEKVRRRKMPNEIDHKEVVYTLMNFDREVWCPITIDEENYLVDGQHRLEVAAQMCMRYIDVVVQNRQKIK